jgi:hypothetical protein
MCIAAQARDSCKHLVLVHTCWLGELDLWQSYDTVWPHLEHDTPKHDDANANGHCLHTK